MKRTLREAAAAEDERDLWAAVSEAISMVSVTRAYTGPAYGCLAVWPMDPLPESCAEEIQRTVGLALHREMEPCCWNLPVGGFVAITEPWAAWCPDCYRRDRTNGEPSCDACDEPIPLKPSGEPVYRVLALAGPYTVDCWLCERCAS
jgi:hypothetical protein